MCCASRGVGENAAWALVREGLRSADPQKFLVNFSKKTQVEESTDVQDEREEGLNKDR